MPNHHSATPTEPVNTSEYAKYLLRGKREIVQILQGLIDAHALISIHVSPKDYSFLTTIVGFTDTTLFLDASSDEAIHQRVAMAERLLCIGQLEKIRIQFSLNSASFTLYDGLSAYSTPLPAELLRLQRREFYRLRTPAANPVICTVMVPPKENSNDTVKIEVRVADISGGGIAIMVPANDTHFLPGAEFDNCTLTLPELGEISVRLKVRNLFKQTIHGGDVETLRAGCEFVDLPRNADSAIQRYIFKVERDRNARERGGL